MTTILHLLKSRNWESVKVTIQCQYSSEKYKLKAKASLKFMNSHYEEHAANTYVRTNDKIPIEKKAVTLNSALFLYYTLKVNEEANWERKERKKMERERGWGEVS